MLKDNRLKAEEMKRNIRRTSKCIESLLSSTGQKRLHKVMQRAQGQARTYHCQEEHQETKRTVCVGPTRNEPAVDNFRLEGRNDKSMGILQICCNSTKMFSFPRRCKGRKYKRVKTESSHGVP